MSGLALDRGWRTRAATVVLAGVGAVVTPVWYLRAVAPVDAYFAHPIYPDQVFAALLAGVLLVLAGWQAFAALRERDRARLRAVAIAGDISAMPRARLTGDWFDAHVRQGVPVVVEWRVGPSAIRSG